MLYSLVQKKMLKITWDPLGKLTGLYPNELLPGKKTRHTRWTEPSLPLDPDLGAPAFSVDHCPAISCLEVVLQSCPCRFCGRCCKLLRADRWLGADSWPPGWETGCQYQTGAMGPACTCVRVKLEVVERKSDWLAPKCLTTKNSKPPFGSSPFLFFLLPPWLLLSLRSCKPSYPEGVQWVTRPGSLPWGVAASKVQRPTAYKMKFAFQLFLHYCLAAPEIWLTLHFAGG